jgi:hypothetical protein
MENFGWQLTPSASGRTVVPSQYGALMDAPDSIWNIPAKTFSPIGAGCVAYACTAASFTRGLGYDTEIVKRIEAAR